MPSEADYEFGNTAVLRGLLRQEHLEECIEVLVALERVGSLDRLWDVIARKGHMSNARIDELRSSLEEARAGPAGSTQQIETQPAADIELDSLAASSEDSWAWDVPIDAEIEEAESPMAIIGIETVGASDAPPSAKGFAPGELKLTGVRGSTKGRSFVLAAEKNIIGRDNKANITIKGQSVSRHHAEVNFKHGRVTIRDLGSRNGIKVNGAEVREALLIPGETVLIGSCLFVVEETVPHQ